MNIYKHTNEMPMESTYSEISKLLGWDKIHVEIPKVEELDALYEKAKNNDVDSFYQLMKINRFGEARMIAVKKGQILNGVKCKQDMQIVDSEEMERINLAVKYFRETQDLYRK